MFSTFFFPIFSSCVFCFLHVSRTSGVGSGRVRPGLALRWTEWAGRDELAFMHVMELTFSFHWLLRMIYLMEQSVVHLALSRLTIWDAMRCLLRSHIKKVQMYISHLKKSRDQKALTNYMRLTVTRGYIHITALCPKASCVICFTKNRLESPGRHHEGICR